MAYESEENLNTDIQPSNEEIEHILQTQALRAEQLLQNQRDKLIVLVEALLLHGTISAEQFSGLVNIPLRQTTEGPLEPWHDLWFEFRSA
jgi:cell division protease FtsH